MKNNYKRISIMGMLCAIAYIAVIICRIPIVLFLSYEPKDVIIVTAGFIYGPLSSFIISLVVSFIEMITISVDGPIGFIMNILSSCAFAVTASVIYKKKRTLGGAVTGLISGVAVLTAVMLLWNYIITPLYMKVPRAEVIKLLIPAFLPFNLIKGVLNSAITLIIYKPLVKALRSARLIPEAEQKGKSFSYIGLSLISAVVIITCTLVVLILNGTL